MVFIKIQDFPSILHIFTPLLGTVWAIQKCSCLWDGNVGKQQSFFHRSAVINKFISSYLTTILTWWKSHHDPALPPLSAIDIFRWVKHFLVFFQLRYISQLFLGKFLASPYILPEIIPPWFLLVCFRHFSHLGLGYLKQRYDSFDVISFHLVFRLNLYSFIIVLP